MVCLQLFEGRITRKARELRAELQGLLGTGCFGQRRGTAWCRDGLRDLWTQGEAHSNGSVVDLAELADRAEP